MMNIIVTFQLGLGFESVACAIVGHYIGAKKLSYSISYFKTVFYVSLIFVFSTLLILQTFQ